MNALTTKQTIEGVSQKPSTPVALAETLVTMAVALVRELGVAEGFAVTVEDGSCASTCRCKAVTSLAESSAFFLIVTLP
ncbi:MAG TPA: hypothetical protein VEG65_00485 [Candidatus Bathyarchaeia archaeon]|nr:hypothetical protein [Candidatus Bathyarchaeia archaeon]